jgi:cystathionine beta-lyase
MAAIDLHVPGLAALHERRSQKWSLVPDDVLPVPVAEMDFPLAEPVAEALRAAIDRHDLGYAPAAPASLRESFAAFAARRLRWRVDPEQVILAPDVMAGIIELARVLDGPVAFATPAYPPFFSELPYGAPRLEPVPLRADGSHDLDGLRAAFRRGARTLLLSNPHNPTGRVLPRGELEALAELCAEHGAWVLADEIHAPLVHGEAEHTPWLEVSDAARACGFALTSASKAFNVAGLKAALIVTASSRARDVVSRLPQLSERAGLLGVIAAEAAFAEGDEWLDALLTRLAANRELLAAGLPAVRWTPPQATYLAWLDCRGLALGDDPAAAFLERGHVAVVAGLDFGPEGAGFVRLNFGTSAELVTEAVRRMTAALRQPARRRSAAG